MKLGPYWTAWKPDENQGQTIEWLSYWMKEQDYEACDGYEVVFSNGQFEHRPKKLKAS